uniref:MFS domain-containing protein n=1 Tax=Caenorhabditis japonica TaxID=281687 RepID=A0A8R1I8B1_CAEJA
MAVSAKISPAKHLAQLEEAHPEDEVPNNDKIKLESLFEGLGSFGRFQQIQFILICIPIAFVSMHVMSWTFVVSSARKICDEFNETSGIECNELAYSASDRWEMAGDNGWIRATVQSLYFIGQMVGSFTCGVMADKIGRKKVIFLCLVLQVTCALSLIVAPTWWLYAILKAGTGFTQPGIYGVAVVLGIELVGKQYRSFIAVIANVFGVIGGVALAVLAYFIVDYRLLHASIAIPSLIFITYWWIIHESARWLVSQEKYKEANVVLYATASMNKKTVPTDWTSQMEKKMDVTATKKKDTFGVVDLVRTPQMRKRTVANFIMWPVTTMMYYGLTMRSDVGGGSLFVTFITSQLMELPAVIIVALLIDRLGRKIMYSGSIFTAGVLLLANWMTHDYIPSQYAVIMLMVAKCAVSTAYTVMYTYTSELFPTVIRNTAVGCCSTIARFGAITASFIAFFLVDRYGRIVMIIPFTILALLASVVSFVMLPETNNKTLPDSISEVEGNTI